MFSNTFINSNNKQYVAFPAVLNALFPKLKTVDVLIHATICKKRLIQLEDEELLIFISIKDAIDHLLDLKKKMDDHYAPLIDEIIRWVNQDEFPKMNLNKNNFPQYYTALKKVKEFKRSINEVKIDKTEAVYFLLDPSANRIKIGTSSNIDTRIANLNTASSTDLELVYVLEGGHTLENQLHKRFSKYKVKGEWFEYSEDIKLFIKKRP